MVGESKGQRSQYAYRVGGGAEGHYGHVAGVEAAATDETKVLIHHGLAAKQAVERGSRRHPHAAGCVVHGAPSEALTALAVPDLVFRTGRVSVDVELAKDLEGDLVQHSEDLPVVLLPAGECGEARVPEAVHPALVVEPDVRHVFEGRRRLNEIVVV